MNKMCYKQVLKAIGVSEILCIFFLVFVFGLVKDIMECNDASSYLIYYGHI